jgi:hypothetical protein
MLYIVSVGETKYSTTQFGFADQNTAVNFAALAKDKAIEDVEVTIELKHEDEVEA